MFMFDRIVRGKRRFDCMQVRDYTHISFLVFSTSMQTQCIPLSLTKIPSTARASWDLLVCSLAFPEFTLPEKARMAAAPPMPILPVLEVCTASALPMMG